MLSISNILIITATIFTLGAQLYPSIYVFGMNDHFLSQWNYLLYSVQFFSSMFLHGSMMHLLGNSIFVYIFGNQIESHLGGKKYIFFFVFSAVSIGSAVTLFSSVNTIGMSGFVMAILTYYTLYLRSKNNPDYKGWITALVLNIWVWFFPGISLVGHLFGAIVGAVFYFLDREIYKKCFIGKVDET